jgi:hypothetical protein
MNHLMRNKYGVPGSNIRIVADDGHLAPTKKNILQALTSLLRSGKKHLWFTYSGHGSHQRDENGDEPDGRDETLVPSDYLNAGMIVDDTISDLLVKWLPPGVSFTAIYDCCHAGSMSDLPLSFSSKNPSLPMRSSLRDVLCEKSGQILSLSACSDSQTSVSAYNLDRKKGWAGALTYAFSNLPAGDLAGDVILRNIDALMIRRKFGQITTLSTNRSDVTHSNQIIFPFPTE